MTSPALNPAAFFDPAAFAIVVGGTLLVAALRTPVSDLIRAMAAMTTLRRRRFDPEPLAQQIAAQARIAQRHGAVALDRSVIADADLAAAIAAIVDGANGDQVAALMAERASARTARHAGAIDCWAGITEAAPAMGMVGTLIGLVAMFTRMTDAHAIGAAMAVALLATLYGALLANVVASPIAARLRAAALHERAGRETLIAPLVALATREAPRPVQLTPVPTRVRAKDAA